MRLIHLKLSEFKQHRSFETRLDESVVGITGLNHSGKTSILRSIRWLLTGKLDGKQEHHVYGYGQKGPTSASGSLTFEKGGHTGTITRTCGATSKRTLVWDGQSYLKAADVDEKMSEIFGADLNSVDKVMFIKQGELASALFGTPADRERLFVTILDIGYLTKAAEALEEKIRFFEANSWSGGPDLIAALQEGIQGLEVDLQQTAARYRAVADYKTTYKDLQGIKAIADALESCERGMRTLFAKITGLRETLGTMDEEPMYEARLAVIQQEIENLSVALENQERIAQMETERLALDAEIQQLQRQLAECESPVPGYSEALEHGRKNRDLYSKIEELGLPKCKYTLSGLQQATERITGYVARITQLRAEEQIPGPTTEDIDALQTEYNILDYALQFVEMKKKGQCRCPMCGSEAAKYSVEEESEILRKRDQAISNLSDAKIRARDYRARTDKIISQIAAETRALEDDARRVSQYKEVLSVFGSTDVATAIQEYELYKALVDPLELVHQSRAQMLPVVKSTLESRERSRASLESVPSSATDVRALRAALDSEKAKRADTQLSLDKLRYTVVTIAQTQATLAEELHRREAIRNLLPPFMEKYDLPYINKLVEDSSYMSNELETARSEAETAAELQGAIHAYTAQLSDMRVKLLDASAKSVEAEVKAHFIERLRQARDVFKKGALPSAYVEHKFGELCEASKEFLSRTDASFEIERDPEQVVGFIFREMDDPDAVWQPQESLSGGQRVRLSVAFLIAVQQVLIPDLGLLILDEPSQHVDEPGVESLQELLSGIGRLLSDAGSQIIVCDHNEKLIPAYNIHIQL